VHHEALAPRHLRRDRDREKERREIERKRERENEEKREKKQGQRLVCHVSIRMISIHIKSDTEEIFNSPVSLVLLRCPILGVRTRLLNCREAVLE